MSLSPPTLVSLLLQHAEDLGLGREGHVAYLVEEEGAAVGLLELALMLFLGPGEGALLVTEELALYKLAGDGRAVDLNKGHRSPVALFVQPSGHQFLTGSIGTCDEHPGVGRGHPVYHVLDTDDGRRLADNLLHPADLLLEDLGLADEGALVRSIFQSNQYPVQVQRLLNEVECTLLFRAS